MSNHKPWSLIGFRTHYFSVAAVGTTVAMGLLWFATTVGVKAVLILSRKTGESIRIGPDIEIRVLAVQGKKVRLGISAPSDRSIWRAELTTDGEGLPAKHREAELNAVCWDGWAEIEKAVHPRYPIQFRCAIIPPGDVIPTRLENRSILQVLNPAYRRA